jgi:glutamate N-acetyltransferase/amino-acid N-acetyltransferase
MSVTAAQGFEAAGVACGIKPSGSSDLALVATSDRKAVAAAGVFTSNLATAAPVQVSREHLANGQAAAIILSSGNANAATGEPGRVDARRMCDAAAGWLGCAADEVLVCSTGLIGIPLPMEPIESGIPKVASALAAGEKAGAAAADAILTTDTVRKESAVVVERSEGGRYAVGGMAKGAAMLAPALATMLAAITTDAAVDADALQAALTSAVDETFNALLVDGCTSTNDTVLVLANGAAGGPVMTAKSPGFAGFVEALTHVCSELADAMAADAEGATKLARVTVDGAASTGDARSAARAVAGSQLVQCSLFGCDPYWGRVLSELGASGAALDPEQVDISYNGITVCRGGVTVAHDETALEAAMAEREIDIVCTLHAGTSTAQVRFTDLSHAYIDENMGTS